MATAPVVSPVAGKLINLIVRQAKKLSPFLTLRSYADADDVAKQFDDLNSLVNQVTVSHLGYEVPDKNDWLAGVPLRSGFSVQPCFYTEIYEDDDLSVGIFNLRDSGCEIPLHNHPDIHGMIRVIFGRLRITSFSWLTPEQERVVELPPSGFKEKLSRSDMRFVRPAISEGVFRVTPDNSAAIVSPRIGNIHRVEAMDGSAGFLDVLIPRYNPPQRDCHYFKVLEPVNQDELEEGGQMKYCDGRSVPGLTWLKQIPPPKSYWCSEWAYTGPEIKLEEKEDLK